MRVTDTGNVQANLSGLVVENTFGQFGLVYYFSSSQGLNKLIFFSQICAGGISASTK